MARSNCEFEDGKLKLQIHAGHFFKPWLGLLEFQEHLFFSKDQVYVYSAPSAHGFTCGVATHGAN